MRLVGDRIVGWDEQEVDIPRLEGKVAQISGSATGQGAVEAKLFAQLGAKVVIGDILEAEGKHVEAEMTKKSDAENE